MQTHKQGFELLPGGLALVRLVGHFTAQCVLDRRREDVASLIESPKACVLDLRASTFAHGALVDALSQVVGAVPYALLVTPARRPEAMLDCYALATFGQLALPFTSESDALAWAQARARRWEPLQWHGSRASPGRKPEHA